MNRNVRWRHNQTKRIWELHNKRCFYCGKFMALHETTKDHLWPVSKFPEHVGRSAELTKVPAHRECNGKKADRPPTYREISRLILILAKASYKVTPHV